jgi:glutamate-5-semialdehyde dehydrogenase
MKEAVAEDINPDVIALIEDTDRSLLLELLKAKEYVDLVVPRGGKKLIDHVVNNAKVPYIETGAGNCHVYVDEEVDYEMALNIIINAKTQRPSVCNAIETILVNDKIKEEFLPLLQKELGKYCVEIRGCESTNKVIKVKLATEEDYYQEYNDYIVTIKVVNDLDEAINHINKYGTKHSDCILTTNNEKAEQFLNKIDSACVYVNASTRFSDGGEFGFGAELGISTQKLHARGPMGLKEMTTYKYKIYGEGQVRK